ncbi:MAG TPA: hypothetical protein EYN96_06515 [Candidatus Hydrogenedentes bacterium]|nr:hypothetical protein [Candidatus Hydrogenedentota bacterium]
MIKIRLQYIESNIHSAKNRVRHSMNGALISMGVRNPALQKKAIAAAKRIGKVKSIMVRPAVKLPTQ